LDPGARSVIIPSREQMSSPSEPNLQGIAARSEADVRSRSNGSIITPSGGVSWT
jgi:hypothetical protein